MWSVSTYQCRPPCRWGWVCTPQSSPPVWRKRPSGSTASARLPRNNPSLNMKKKGPNTAWVTWTVNGRVLNNESCKKNYNQGQDISRITRSTQRTLTHQKTLGIIFLPYWNIGLIFQSSQITFRTESWKPSQLGPKISYSWKPDKNNNKTLQST